MFRFNIKIRNFNTFSFLKNTQTNPYSATENKLQLIESSRLDDSLNELKRLEKNPMINDRFTKMKIYYKNSKFDQPLSIFHQVSYGRSLEIFENIKDSHYIFHHGQSSSAFLPLNILNKLLLEPILPKKNLKFETILRHSSSLKEIQPDLQDIEWYKQVLTWKNLSRSPFMHKFSDHKYTNSLISADGYLASPAISESALSIFNSNICGNKQSDIVNAAIELIAKYYIPDKKIQQNFIEEFKKISENNPHLHSGVLYSICIPKEYFIECGYLSETFGVAASIRNEDIHNILKKMQEETNFQEDESYYPCYPKKSLYQVRLLAHKLIPEKIKIFMFPALSDQELSEINEKTLKLFQLFSNYFNKEESCILGNAHRLNYR